MINLKSSNLIAALFALVWMGYSSLYIVDEGQKAIVLSIGEKVQVKSPEQLMVVSPGLHYKLPMFEQVHKIDTRWRTWVKKSQPLTTSDQRTLTLEYLVSWKVDKPAQYFAVTGAKFASVQEALESEINHTLRLVVAQLSLQQLATDGQQQLGQALQSAAEKAMAKLGVKVGLAKIKTLVLPEDLSAAIYHQMRTEFEEAAMQYRAQGKLITETAHAEADKKMLLLLADAKLKAAEIRADGDRQAAQIAADAYGKDPEFYAFYQSLLVYKKAFNKPEDILILKPEGEFFKYFKSTSRQQK